MLTNRSLKMSRRLFQKYKRFRQDNGGSQNERLLNNSEDDEDEVSSNRETLRDFLKSMFV